VHEKNTLHLTLNAHFSLKNILGVTMPKANFIPAADQEFHAWFEHLANNLTLEAGVTSDDIAAVKAAYSDFNDQLINVTDTSALAKQATRNKTDSRQYAEELIRSLNRRIKAHSDYTSGMGAKLGIIGTGHQHNLANSRPVLKGTDFTGGKVSISFTKYESDGINIYSKREGDLDWILIGRATVSPFIDKRPLLEIGKPEVRSYCATYMLKDKEIGHYSDDLTISCAP
jgi:hypothetical protein